MFSPKPLKLFRIWDIAVVVALLALVVLTLVFVFLPAKGREAEIYLDGERIMTVSLDDDREIKIDHMTIIVEKGTIRVVDVDCPDKICQARGAISKAGQTIVCVPNRIVIKIAGKSEVEAIT